MNFFKAAARPLLQIFLWPYLVVREELRFQAGLN